MTERELQAQDAEVTRLISELVITAQCGDTEEIDAAKDDLHEYITELRGGEQREPDAYVPTLADGTPLWQHTARSRDRAVRAFHGGVAPVRSVYLDTPPAARVEPDFTQWNRLLDRYDEAVRLSALGLKSSGPAMGARRALNEYVGGLLIAASRATDAGRSTRDDAWVYPRVGDRVQRNYDGGVGTVREVAAATHYMVNVEWDDGWSERVNFSHVGPSGLHVLGTDGETAGNYDADHDSTDAGRSEPAGAAQPKEG